MCRKIREVLIKSGMQIAQTDFSSGGKYASKMRAAIYSALPKEKKGKV